MLCVTDTSGVSRVNLLCHAPPLKTHCLSSSQYSSTTTTLQSTIKLMGHFANEGTCSNTAEIGNERHMMSLLPRGMATDCHVSFCNTSTSLTQICTSCLPCQYCMIVPYLYKRSMWYRDSPKREKSHVSCPDREQQLNFTG